jgi:hypothetical protein
MFELEKPWRFVVAEMEIREAFSSSHSLFFCLLFMDGHDASTKLFLLGDVVHRVPPLFFFANKPLNNYNIVSILFLGTSIVGRSIGMFRAENYKTDKNRNYLIWTQF